LAPIAPSARTQRVGHVLRLVWRLIKLTLLSLGALLVVFAAAAFVYSRIVTYESELIAWPAESDFIQPVTWQPRNPKHIRILSINGGGILGVVDLEILKYLETKSGQPIADLFDFVSGPSTGAIITAGLLLPDKTGKPKYSAQALIDAYTDLARQILGSPLYHRVLTLNGLLGPRLLNHTKVILVHQLFGDAQFGDLIRPAMIPVFSRSSGGLEVFRNWDRREANVYLAPLISATTAVPTFFPAVQLEDHNHHAGLYSDAAFVLNNPAELAFLHALERYPDADFTIVSLGTSSRDLVTLDQGVYGGTLDWIGPLLSMIFTGQNDVALSALARLETIHLPFKLDTFRIAPKIDWRWNSMDGSDANIARLKRASTDYIAKNHSELDRVLTELEKIDPSSEGLSTLPSDAAPQ
jgi:predicted acylesterase/phospholipase RssA